MHWWLVTHCQANMLNEVGWPQEWLARDVEFASTIHPISKDFVQQIIYNTPLKWHHHRMFQAENLNVAIFTLQFRDHYFILFAIEITVD